MNETRRSYVRALSVTSTDNIKDASLLEVDDTDLNFASAEDADPDNSQSDVCIRIHISSLCISEYTQCVCYKSNLWFSILIC